MPASGDPIKTGWFEIVAKARRPIGDQYDAAEHEPSFQLVGPGQRDGIGDVALEHFRRRLADRPMARKRKVMTAYHPLRF